jgi:hypothetical protein
MAEVIIMITTAVQRYDQPYTQQHVESTVKVTSILLVEEVWKV